MIEQRIAHEVSKAVMHDHDVYYATWERIPVLRVWVGTGATANIFECADNRTFRVVVEEITGRP